jgi:hypothetical protein
MLGYLIWAFLIYAGWRRFPWWTPFVTFVAAVPVILFQLSSINAWRREASLQAPALDQYGIGFALVSTLVIWLGFFWAGRGAAFLVSRRRQSAPVAYSIDLTSGEHELPSRQLTPESLIEQSRHGSVAFPFKDNAAAFTYACKFLNCNLAEGAMLPALVQDGRELFGTQESVHAKPDRTQTAVLKIASRDGGFLVVATTPGRGPVLKPGDFVGWLAGHHSAKLAESSADKRFGWVGVIVGTLRPEWKDGSWVGQERFGTR